MSKTNLNKWDDALLLPTTSKTGLKNQTFNTPAHSTRQTTASDIVNTQTLTDSMTTTNTILIGRSTSDLDRSLNQTSRILGKR